MIYIYYYRDFRKRIGSNTWKRKADRRTRCSNSVAAAAATQTPSALSLQLCHRTSTNFVAHSRAWSMEVVAHSSAHCVRLRSRPSPLPSLLAVCLFLVAVDAHLVVSSRLRRISTELWQKENKGVIGILLVQDSAETSTVDPALSPECTLKNQASISDLTNMMEKVCSKFTGISGELLLEPCISQEEWRDQVGE
nr:lon protease homolog 2, peroxisomal isoform X2 [Ipomoea batatas]